MAFALRYVYRIDVPVENLAGSLARHLACGVRQGQVVRMAPDANGAAGPPSSFQTHDLLVSSPDEGENGETAPSISLWADGQGQLFMEVRLERKVLRAFNPAFGPDMGDGGVGTAETSFFWYHRAADQFLRAQGASPVAEVRDMVIADW